MKITWNRRHFLQLCLGGIAALPLFRVARALPDGRPACRLTPEQTEGPYYLDRALLRQDITEGKPGLPLTLRFDVLDSRTCRPLSGTALEVWHCDAQGLYSGFTAMTPAGPGMGPPPGRPPHGMPPGPPPGAGGRPHGMPPKSVSTDPLTFLRGAQLADARGQAEFRTIFPGYYAGRCNHIHLKLHVGGEMQDGHYRGGHVVHTGQLFFPEAASLTAMAGAPYQRQGESRITLDEDNVYTTQHGSESMATLSMENGVQVARLTLAVDPSALSRDSLG
ncbi:intradiol ring-cleavage dioxygenase [Dyella silvae]|uniref:intradiol ring-cleavage dioxygenase n=1 Tax=Dyella silvae TaxID=2994424 RepID=UPI002264E7C3|nr:intradiol ring-cleavage dioxygenase [Dyella silvae]